jgi:hypothetical protein
VSFSDSSEYSYYYRDGSDSDGNFKFPQAAPRASDSESLAGWTQLDAKPKNLQAFSS